MEKQIILYSETFKGYARLSNIMKGKTRTGLKIEFTNDKEAATTFENEQAKEHFIKNFAIGVNYNFKTELI